MSTESDESGQEGNAILARACDSCRTKKIGCDKKYPCSRCKANNLVCQASAPRARDKKQRIHVSEKFEKQMNSLHIRLENIENLLRVRLDDPRQAPFIEPDSSLPTKVQIDETLLKQTRAHINASKLILGASELGPLGILENELDQDSSKFYLGDSSLLSATTEAKNLLERGLTPESGGPVDHERNPSLSVAMKALNQLMKSKHHDDIYFPTETQYKQEMSMKSLPVPPLKDIIRIMQDDAFQGFWPMIPIRRERFEAMYQQVASSLSTERVNTAAFLCVNGFLPFLFQQLLMCSKSDRKYTGIPASDIEEILKKCTYNAQVAARNLGLLMAPTLENILALLFASLIAQENGTPGECWTYASHACRLVQALGLHRRSAYKNMPYEEAEEAKTAFWWCYSIDKGLALNFGRSPQLLDYDIDVDMPEMQTGSWGRAYYVYCRAYIELGRIQSRIYTELYSVAAGRASTEDRERATQGIVTDLKAWWLRSCQAFSQSPEFQSQPDLIAETYLMRFGFYTNLALVYRVRSTHSSATPPPFGTPPYDPDCLNSARQALAVCKILQTDFRDSFSLASIAQWLFLYYPLTPYFILFGNVVSTGDQGDLRIMEETLAFLSMVREENGGMEKLARLMTVFLRVATILVEARRGQRQSRGGIEVGDSPTCVSTSDFGMAVPDPRIILPDEDYALRRPTPPRSIFPNVPTSMPPIVTSAPAVTMAEAPAPLHNFAGVPGMGEAMGMQELGGFSDMDWEFFAQQPSMNFFSADVGGEFAFLLNEQGGGPAETQGVQW
ncbi:hypothetical protein BJ508DRAFT_418443 [Ascobolus immersus RN42]|uniref:Zn(2)-C6 fungal-type domain-containing protein n=1 Tax=Ascobolus immersus RN42 TaxID=1160509 RepID=A0A3N4HLS8_ASCIM|nr:hypothetical protein BJ508DRAFT_418443 [Ascobolus immersus RN42]